MPIAKSHAQSAHRANVVSAADAVAVVVNALRTASVTNQSVQKAATSLAPTTVPTTPLATRAVSPAKDVVKVAKVAKVAMVAEVVAMAVVHALKVTHATQTVKAPSRPNRVSQTQTQRLLL